MSQLLPLSLHYTSYAPGKSPLVVLHGFLGSSGNWSTLSRTAFSALRTVYAVDARNHGRSPHDGGFSYALMALDTVGFLDAHQILATDLLGHSMGGKTAMTTALRYPERVRSLIVADMAPRAYTPGHDALLEALASLDLSSVTSRQQADEHLAAQGVSNWGVRQFLLKNLTRTDGGYAWAPNLDVLRARYEEVLAPVTSDNSYDGPTLFIRGGTSGYVRDDDWPGIERLFPNARLVTIPDAGHWVHAEAPQAFGDAVTTFLAEIDAG